VYGSTQTHVNEYLIIGDVILLNTKLAIIFMNVYKLILMNSIYSAQIIILHVNFYTHFIF